MDLETLQVTQIINGGALVAFVWVTYRKLDSIVESLRKMSEALVKMEERGHRLQRPTPPPSHWGRGAAPTHLRELTDDGPTPEPYHRRETEDQ